MFRKLYRFLFPLALRQAAGRLRNAFCAWYWHMEPRLPFNKYWRAKVRACRPTYRRAVLRRHRALLETGRPIRVVFEVSMLPKWKADSLLAAMLRHPRFVPVVWVVPMLGRDSAQGAWEHAACVEYFRGTGVEVVQYAALADFPAGEDPDIIFPAELYDLSVYGAGYNRGMLDKLVCYIPYGMVSTCSPLNFDQVINNAALYNFYESDATLQMARKLARNKGVNVCVSGHTMADAFLYPPRPHPVVWKDCGCGHKRVIWAPHWSIADDSSWLRFGTFLKTGDVMLELAREHAGDMQFAFKPHPNLYPTLCKHPEWGKERADAFYRAWAEMPNTQLETGAYAALFMQSDAMVHDCGSFIQEYLFADKPCMYLQEGAGYQGYSDMAADCLNAYHRGLLREEIEKFLQMVLRGEDPKAAVRRELRRKYLLPPHGKSAAQNIIDCLLGNAGE